MKFLIPIALVFLLNVIHRAQGGGGYGGGYGGDYGGDYGKEYGGEYEKKEYQPAVIKPEGPHYVKPVFHSYKKYAGHGGYGKTIPISKLPEYGPRIDFSKFVVPYQGAHLLQKHGHPIPIIKHAPPLYIRQPTIKKVIYQDVTVEQPVHILKQPRIHKKKTVTINKNPAVVTYDEKAPVDVQDYSKTAVVKGVKHEIPKEYEGGYKGGEEYGKGGEEYGKKGEEYGKKGEEYGKKGEEYAGTE